MASDSDPDLLLQPVQEFLDPVHDFVHYTEAEVAVIDHPAFQRLFNIHQLGQTNLVFRGATHRRGEHALGAVAAADELVAALERSYRRHQQQPAAGDPCEPPTEWQLSQGLRPTEVVFLRLAVLLHDIGHVVAGHTLEDELGLLGAHDGTKRLNYVLDHRTWGGVHTSDPMIPKGPPLWLNETLRERIDRVYSELLQRSGIQIIQTSDPAGQQRLFEDVGVQPTQILLQIICEDQKEECEPDRYRCHPTGEPFRIAVIRDMVSDTVCADLIDYLVRDWEHIGKSRQLDTRLLQYMEIRSSSRTAKSHLVVNIDSGSEPGYRSDIVSAILELLENRYHLWEVALLHRTKTAAGAMLERAIAEKLDDANLLSHMSPRPSITDNPHLDPESRILEAIFEASDTDIYDAFTAAPWDPPERTESSETKLDSAGSVLFWRLRHRILHKQIARVSYGPYAHRISEFLAPKDAAPPKKIEAAKDRLQSLRILEDDFELERGSLAMHIVPYGLGKKLARIRVFYGGEVIRFNELDEHQETNFSGGHLQAQLNRFDQLWRASLFLAPEQKAKLEEEGLLELLGIAFRLAVLHIGVDDWTLHRIAEKLQQQGAVQYARTRPLLSEAQRAARGFSEDLVYPSAQPTLRSFFG